MNVYDFDQTIYNGNAMVDFYFFLLKKKPYLIVRGLKSAYMLWAWKAGKILKKDLKSDLYTVIRHFDIDKELKEFWETHKIKIKDWYLKQKKKSDIIISGSPKFLLKPICKELGVKLIAAEIDLKTGKWIDEDCESEEKVKRYKKKHWIRKIDNFYSDSDDDIPLAKFAKRSFKVKGNEITEWFC